MCCWHIMFNSFIHPHEKRSSTVAPYTRYISLTEYCMRHIRCEAIRKMCGGCKFNAWAVGIVWYWYIHLPLPLAHYSNIHTHTHLFVYNLTYTIYTSSIFTKMYINVINCVYLFNLGKWGIFFLAYICWNVFFMLTVQSWRRRRRLPTYKYIFLERFPKALCNYSIGVLKHTVVRATCFFFLLFRSLWVCICIEKMCTH